MARTWVVEFSRAIAQSEQPPGSGNSLPRFCMTAIWSLFRIQIGECYTMKCMYHVPCRDPVRLTGWERGELKIGAARLSCRRKDSKRGVQSGKGNSVASLFLGTRTLGAAALGLDPPVLSPRVLWRVGNAVPWYVPVRRRTVCLAILDLVDESLVGFSIFEYGHGVAC